MPYEVMFEKGDIALLSKENEYVVAVGFDPTQPYGRQWCRGFYFTHQGLEDKKAGALFMALDTFRSYTERGEYIAYSRLHELSGLFAKGLLLDNEEEANKYFIGECEMSGEELRLVGVRE